MRKFFDGLKNVLLLVSEDELPVFAAQASYYIIISAFPFMMLFLSLVGFIFPLEKQALNETIASFVPETIGGILYTITDELFAKSIHIVSLTALTAFWTASRGIASIERGIHRIYHAPRSKTVIHEMLLSFVYTLLFMAILLLTLGLQVFGNTILNFITSRTGIILKDIMFIKGALFFILLVLIFQLMYYVFGRRKIPYKLNIIGAVFSAAGWMIFSKLYSIYIDNFANYSYIYGSITAVVLLMIWLFFCVTILLAGAEINRFISGIEQGPITGKDEKK